MEWEEYKAGFRATLACMNPWDRSMLDNRAERDVACVAIPDTIQVLQGLVLQVFNVRHHLQNGRSDQVANMPFVYHRFMESLSPSSGKPCLYIALHGGGNTTDENNTKDWIRYSKMLMDCWRRTKRQDVLVCARSPTNTTKMWHKNGVYELFDALVKSMIVEEGIDSNRVYLFGYSAGGNGTFKVVPRMADRWAAGASMAGHPGNTDLTNLCNTPFAILCGAHDSHYQRIQRNRERALALQNLHEQYNHEMYHNMHLFPDTGHWMNAQDLVAIDWMAQFTRNPVPGHVLWKLKPPDVMNRFFWLGLICPSIDDLPWKQRSWFHVSARIDGQDIFIEVLEHTPRQGKQDVLLVRFNDSMPVDIESPVHIVLNSSSPQTFHLESSPDIARQTLLEYGDPNMVFSSEIRLHL